VKLHYFVRLRRTLYASMRKQSPATLMTPSRRTVGYLRLRLVHPAGGLHAGRNIAEASWLRSLARGSRETGATPYATLGDDGELQLHPPKTYPAWWLHRRLATVAVLEKLWASFDAMKRTSQANAVTKKLLLELDEVVRQSGGRLLVALLSQVGPRRMAPFRALLAEHGIPTAECVHQGVWAKEMQVPVYGHPNAEINAYWAGCIAQAIGGMVPELAVALRLGDSRASLQGRPCRRRPERRSCSITTSGTARVRTAPVGPGAPSPSATSAPARGRGIAGGPEPDELFRFPLLRDVLQAEEGGDILVL
jgi:hypothetical protein